MTFPTIEESIKGKLMGEYDVWEESFDRQGNIIGKKIKFTNLGELLYKGLNLRFLTLIDDERIYRYNGGYYDSDGEQLIKKLVEDFLEEETKEHLKTEIVGYIRDKNYQKREIFDSHPNLLNLKNGVYDIKKRKFGEHNPDYYFLNEIPVEYKPKAKINRIKQFLKEVVKPDDVLLLQEIFGYCLYRSYPIQKAIMFLGQGANGKSTTLSLLIELLGRKNVSAISLQDLVDSRFACSGLYSKLANIYPDITDKALGQTGLFKMVTGGDMLTAEQKFRDPFNFVNYSKLIFSANKLPEAKDDTDAYFRRWVFVNFPHTFEGKKCNPKILSQLTTEEEMSGLLNFALKGLKRLLANGTFTNTQTTDTMRETYQRLASPIAAFVMDCIEVQPKNYVKKDDLYAVFVQYCMEKGLPVVAKNTFSMKIQEYVIVNDYKATISGKRVHTWLGIAIKNMSEMSKMSTTFLTLLQGKEINNDLIIEKHPDSLDQFDQSKIQGPSDPSRLSNENGLEGFKTIKMEHIEWAKDLLMNNKGMPVKFFEEEFYNEFGQSFLANEINQIYKTININIKNESEEG